MRHPPVFVLLAALVAALVPWYVTNGLVILVAGLLWLAGAIVYYRRVRTNDALWVFLLVPMVFWPFVLQLLIFVGVIVGRGNF